MSGARIKGVKDRCPAEPAPYWQWRRSYGAKGRDLSRSAAKWWARPWWDAWFRMSERRGEERMPTTQVANAGVGPRHSSEPLPTTQRRAWKRRRYVQGLHR